MLKSFEADDGAGAKVRAGLFEDDDVSKLTLCHVRDEEAECWSTKEGAVELYELAKKVYAGLGMKTREVHLEEFRGVG